MLEFGEDTTMNLELEEEEKDNVTPLVNKKKRVVSQ